MYTCLRSTSQANQYDLNFLPVFPFDRFMELACEARVTTWCLVGFLITFLPSGVRLSCSSLCSLVLLPALQVHPRIFCHMPFLSAIAIICLCQCCLLIVLSACCTLPAIRLSFRLAYVPVLCTNALNTEAIFVLLFSTVRYWNTAKKGVQEQSNRNGYSVFRKRVQKEYL
jgi:hypothetical protein